MITITRKENSLVATFSYKESVVIYKWLAKMVQYSKNKESKVFKNHSELLASSVLCSFFKEKLHNKKSGNILIELSISDAMVLFDWLADFHDMPEEENYRLLSSLFETQEEENFTYAFQHVLAEQIDCVFSENYVEELSKAQEEVLKKYFQK